MPAFPEDIVYDDLRDVAPAGAVVKGEMALVEDVVGFYLNATAMNVEGTFMYRCKQARVSKNDGSGTAIVAGQKLYADLALQIVTPTFASGLYFVGWAKEDAADEDEFVLMRWDGTLWEVIP